MAIRWVIFDAMGVIFEHRHHISECLVPFIHQRRADISEQVIGDLYLRASVGAITSAQIWEAMGLGAAYPDIETAFVQNCLRLNPLFVPLAQALRPTYALGMLSNDVREWSAAVRKHYQIAHLFSKVIISGEVGYRKPDPRIYRLLLEQFQAEPSACVFIDDSLPNLEPASRLGMRTIWFAREARAYPFQPDRTVHAFAELLAILPTL